MSDELKKTMEELRLKMAINRVDWWGVQHKDGWWMGTEEGVITFEDFDWARAFNTIMWQWDYGPRVWPFRVKILGELPTRKKEGDWVPKRSARAALKFYERQAKNE